MSVDKIQLRGLENTESWPQSIWSPYFIEMNMFKADTRNGFGFPFNDHCRGQKSEVHNVSCLFWLFNTYLTEICVKMDVITSCPQNPRQQQSTFTCSNALRSGIRRYWPNFRYIELVDCYRLIYTEDNIYWWRWLIFIRRFLVVLRWLFPKTDKMYLYSVLLGSKQIVGPWKHRTHVF